MNTRTLTVFTLFSVCLLQLPLHGDWQPIVYNGIKWTFQNQGQNTIRYTTNQGITRVPTALHGGVDRNSSGDISNRNIEQFTKWVKKTLPENYCGPVVLDYEEPWWPELSAKTILPQRLQEILSVYEEGIEVSKNILPNAQWGYWGLPLRRNTSSAWLNQGLSLKSLISTSAALYPNIYDGSRGNEQTKQTELFINAVLKEAGGNIPVYVYVSPRYAGEGGDNSYFVPDDIFLRNVNAAMRSVWVDDFGVQHRIKGIIFWDSYGFSQEAEWNNLDQKHKHYFELLQALVKAWKKEMTGTRVDVGLPSSACQFGLPEPANSRSAIDDAPLNEASEGSIENTHELPTRETLRVPSGRVEDNRIVE